MKGVVSLFVIICLVCVNGAPTTESDVITTENYEEPGALTVSQAKEILKKYNDELAVWNNKKELAYWKHASDLTEENLKEKLKVASEAANYLKKIWNEIKSYSWQNLPDANLKRQFQKLSVIDISALSDEEFKEYNEIVSKMQDVYSKATICDYKDKSKCDLALEPELTEMMATSRDPEELKHIWLEWRKASGEKVREMFPKYVELSNRAAQANGYENNKDFWLKEYEDDQIVEQIEHLLKQLEPFYQQIHAYVRRQLFNKYGEKVLSKTGPIPAHLLGNMWAQTWSNIADFTYPYPGKQLPDATEAMVKKGLNAEKIFKLAEQSFVSMNLSAMPESFWKNSILTKPEDRDIVCHASAWDFYDGKDFRIKQCTRVTWEHLLTAHHEMGHVEYFLQYKNQPTIFKEGANPGFHEAVGDLISLSVSSIQHRKKMGLIDSDMVDEEAQLNNLYFTALDKIVFLPFAYSMDYWRWEVFSGGITPHDYNCQWWSFREKFQGIEAPEHRSEDDFDPASKYHIIADVEYLRYFVSFIIQFQFHEALCIEAGQYDPKNPNSKPLHDCDILQSAKAGNLLKSMLEMGSSMPWQDAMEKITGQRTMDASGLLKYFEPLYNWLKKENEKTGEKIGWDSTEKGCVQTRSELRTY